MNFKVIIRFLLIITSGSWESCVARERRGKLPLFRASIQKVLFQLRSLTNPQR